MNKHPNLNQENEQKNKIIHDIYLLLIYGVLKYTYYLIVNKCMKIILNKLPMLKIKI